MLKTACKVDFNDGRAGEIKRFAGHRLRHIKAARTDGDHAQRAAGRGMAVRTDQGFSGFSKPFQMYLMANAVARPGKHYTVFLRHALEITVVVGVFKTDLDGIVVDIADRQLSFHLRDVHGFKLQIGHGARGVLGEGLVDANADFPARREDAVNQMIGEDLFHNVFSHGFFLTGKLR